MSALRALVHSLRALVFRRRADAELDEELAFHLDSEAAMHERDGLSLADARRKAVASFGGVQRYREETRDVRGLAWLHDATADVRFALRLMRRRPAVSGSALLISAIGIAACVTTFSVVSGILLTPLPFPHPDRVFELLLRSSGGDLAGAIPMEAYKRISANAPMIAAIGAYEPAAVTAEWNGEPELLDAQRITPSFFQVFDIRPALGRSFTAAEAANETPVALLGSEIWHERFQADSAVIGTRVRLDGVSHVIVGIMPPRFRAHATAEPSIWLPLRVGGSPEGTRLDALVRLAPGVRQRDAERWLATVVHARSEAVATRDSVETTPALLPITQLIYGFIERPLLILLAAVLLVLLLVAANVATLCLAGSVARQGELDVRRALGASAGRQVRQLVMESLTLTALGGVAGVLACSWTVRVVRGLAVRVLPRLEDVSIDWRVLAFATMAVVVTGVVGGLLPALAIRTGDRRRIAGASTRVTGERTSSGLVIAQITLSVVLLVGAGLLVKSFVRVAPSAPGFALKHRAMLTIVLRGRGYADTTAAGRRRFVATATESLRQVTGVRAVAVTWFVPLVGMVSTTAVSLPGQSELLRGFQNSVSDNYFDVMQMPIRRGRAFQSGDDERVARVAIVNETAASRWWPGRDPIGQRIEISQASHATATIVGIVRNARAFGNSLKPVAEVYYPLAQEPPVYVSFVIHTTGDPAALTPLLKRAIWRAAPTLPIAASKTLDRIAFDASKRARFFSWAMSTFAAVAVLLTALAVYGVLAFAVGQRRREIGIRIALGAAPARVGALVVRRALLLGAAGAVAGLAIARLSTHVLQSLLVEVASTDGFVFAASAAVAILVAAAAACVPAYQAVRVDPVRSLRE